MYGSNRNANRNASAEIAHLWAHQSQNRGSGAAAVSFTGPRFYSYSTVIAEIATNKRGNRAYLLAEHGAYSVTTSKHQGWVENAVPHGATVFTVPPTGSYSRETFADHDRILAAWKREVESKREQLAETTSKRKQERLLGEAEAILREMARYAEFFGIKRYAVPELPRTAAELAEVLKREAKRKAAKAKREEAARIKAEAARRIELAEQRERWLLGEPVDGYALSRVFDTELRIIRGEGDVPLVETLRGAFFPIADAQRGLRLVQAVVASGKPWQANGHTCRIGHYAIDSIDADGTVHAGCHIVKLAAIQRIAPELEAIAS